MVLQCCVSVRFSKNPDPYWILDPLKEKIRIQLFNDHGVGCLSVIVSCYILPIFDYFRIIVNISSFNYFDIPFNFYVYVNFYLFRIKGKKKMNKTGFPLVKKKKKKVITNESESVEEKHKSSPTSPRPSIKKEEKTVKRKQLKMDKFISRKKKKNAESPTRPSGSRDPDLSRRSTTLTKNYRFNTFSIIKNP